MAACSNHKQSGSLNKAKLPAEELRHLSVVINEAPNYFGKIEKQIISARDSLLLSSDDRVRWEIAQYLSFIYRPINADSAYYYADKAQEFSKTLDIKYRQESDLAMVNALSAAGLFTEAMAVFSPLQSSEMTEDTRIKYWIAGRRLFGYMKSYVEGDRIFVNKYNERYLAYDDSLLANLPANDPLRTFISCERMVTEGQYSQAEGGLKNLLANLPEDNNLYGMTAFQLAEVYNHSGDETQYAEYLTKSAISDIKGCIREGLALPALAYWLYQHGELNYAFEFINFALGEASSGNARMRAVSMSKFIPLIDEAYQENINSSHSQQLWALVVTSVLLIATIILTIFLSRQIKRARANEKKLALVADRQKSYIGHFVGLYSSYADRLTRFMKLVSMKLASGQVAELKKLVDSGRFEDQDNDDIYKIFDAAFLDIYPDFISKVNSLLKPEEQIEIKAHSSLSPELRIYAFVKLGVEESARIAQILHYSPNTVYAYRNKMRNKAISRDTFDKDVMEN